MSSPSPPISGGTMNHGQIPSILLHGVPMIKLSNKKVKQRTVWLSAEGPSIRWDSRKLGIVRMDQIREVRYGPPAPPPYPIPGLTPSARTRWISLVYTQPPSSWKTLNIVALTEDDFQLMVRTVRGLLSAIRGIGESELEGGGVIGITGDIERRGPGGLGTGVAVGGGVGVGVGADGLEVGNGDGVGFEECKRVCKGLGVVGRESVALIDYYWKLVQPNNQAYLTPSELTLLLKLIKTQPEIQLLYNDLTASGPLDEKRFRNFLLDVQMTRQTEQGIRRSFESLFEDEREGGESSTTSDGTGNDLGSLAIDTLEGDSDSITPPTPLALTLDQFTGFLSSPSNAILDPVQRKVCQDMSRPLPDYFISSSHNTYLIGHQWKGESTVEGYVRALLAGCRSVEIDIYDGDAEPIVYHGKTLTGSVPVRAVCVAIASYAFMASPYPVIISAEVHCGSESQIKLVQILKEVFGGQLVTGALPGFEGVPEGRLPSPEQLRYRVLFKSKRSIEVEDPKSTDPSVVTFVSDSAESTESSEPDHHHLGRSSTSTSASRGFFDKVTSKVAQLTVASPETPTFRQLPRRSSSLDSRKSSSSASGVKKQTIVPELAALMIYTAGVKYRGFSKLVEYKVEEMFSVSEKVATKILKATPLDFIKHNRGHLSRVYPHGIRLTSTNYAPHHFWAMGAQLVALNWQTCDSGFALNAAMFARNGHSGYIMKPEALRTRNKELLASKERHILQISILSGQSLPVPTDTDVEDSRLYVEVTIHVPAMDASQSIRSVGMTSPSTPGTTTASDTCTGRTRIVSGNTFNPAWQDSVRLSFDAYRGLLDIAFLSVEVKHAVALSDDVTVAHFCASLGTLEQGYRYLPLFDQQMSQYLFSTLFVKINLTV